MVDREREVEGRKKGGGWEKRGKEMPCGCGGVLRRSASCNSSHLPTHIQQRKPASSRPIVAAMETFPACERAEQIDVIGCDGGWARAIGRGFLAPAMLDEGQESCFCVVSGSCAGRGAPVDPSICP